MPLTYEKLIEQYPEDAICAFCGKKNTHWDQEGFLYLWTDSTKTQLADGRPACKECCDGEPGKQHERLHGKGTTGR